MLLILLLCNVIVMLLDKCLCCPYSSHGYLIDVFCCPGSGHLGARSIQNGHWVSSQMWAAPTFSFV